VADRSLVFDIIARAQQFKREMDESARKTEQLNDRMSKLAGRFPLVKAAALGLGPAVLPVLAAATVGAVGFGVALASSGAALGVFGAVAKTALTEVQEYVTQTEAAEKKYADAVAEHGRTSEQAKAAQEALARVTASQPAATRRVADSYRNLTGAWEGFVKRNQPATYGVMTRGMDTLARAVPQLQPLFDVGAAAAGRMVGALERFVGGGGLQGTVRFLADRAGPVLESFGRTAGYVGRGIANMANASGGGGAGLVGWVERGAAAFERWTSSSGGFTGFLSYARENTPRVVATLSDLAGAAVHIAQAVTPLAPVSLAVAGALAKIIAVIPPDVLTVLIGGFIAASVAIRAISVATRAWAIAQVLLNAVLTANPIGLIVVGLVALGVALYAAYQRSETFRRIVNAAMRGAGAAFRWLW
jgi:hypothetical protein